MKTNKRAITVLLLLIVVIIAGYTLYKPQGKVSNAEIVNVASEEFSGDELAEATDCIKKYFTKEFRDCELLKLEYVGDEDNGSKQYEYLPAQYDIDEYIVYKMTFKVGNKDNLSYQKNTTQEINIILGRKGEEDWKYLSAGRP